MRTNELQTFRALTHLAEVINNRQHAGLRITFTMWGELYRVTNEAKAALANIDADAKQATEAKPADENEDTFSDTSWRA